MTVMSQEAFREAQAKAGAMGHQEFGPVVSPEAAALLAAKILAGEYGEGDTVVLGVDKKGELSFGKKLDCWLIERISQDRLRRTQGHPS
jgi:hypothetical protein